MSDIAPWTSPQLTEEQEEAAQINRRLARGIALARHGSMRNAKVNRVADGESELVIASAEIQSAEDPTVWYKTETVVKETGKTARLVFATCASPDTPPPMGGVPVYKQAVALAARTSGLFQTIAKQHVHVVGLK